MGSVRGSGVSRVVSNVGDRGSGGNTRGFLGGGLSPRRSGGLDSILDSRGTLGGLLSDSETGRLFGGLNNGSTRWGAPGKRFL